MPTEPPSLAVPARTRRTAQRRWAWRAALVAGAAALAVGAWRWHALRPENCYRRGRAPLARGRSLTAGERQTVIRESRRLLAAPGWEPQGHLLAGLLFLSDERLEQALGELTHAAGAAATAAEALTAAAECHYLLGRHLPAIEAARAVLERDPDALDARRWLASAYYDLGATVHAARELEIIAAAAPGDPRPHRLLGLIHKDNEQFSEAVDHYRESLRRDPDQSDRPTILLELAESLVKLGRFEEAREVLDKCSRTAQTLTLAAACDESFGQTGDAREQLHAALALDPQFLAAKLQLGSLLLVAGRAGDAVSILEDAVRGAPYSSQAHFRLSQAYSRQGERDKAAEELRLMRETQAVEREFTDLHEEAARKPDDADVRCRIGALARQLDKPDLARLWFRAALAIQPDHAGARAALAEDDGANGDSTAVQPPR
jgi:tetratricopeptide (TPR) repeat protein